MIRTIMTFGLIIALLSGCRGTVEVEEGGRYATQYGDQASAVATSDMMLRDVHATIIDFLSWCDRNPDAVNESQTLTRLKMTCEAEITPPSVQGEMIHTYLLLRRAFDISKDPHDQQMLFNQSKVLADFVNELTQIVGD